MEMLLNFTTTFFKKWVFFFKAAMALTFDQHYAFYSFICPFQGKAASTQLLSRLNTFKVIFYNKM